LVFDQLSPTLALGLRRGSFYEPLHRNTEVTDGHRDTREALAGLQLDGLFGNSHRAADACVDERSGGRAPFRRFAERSGDRAPFRRFAERSGDRAPFRRFANGRVFCSDRRAPQGGRRCDAPAAQ
jgi:hypothetical protein